MQVLFICGEYMRYYYEKPDQFKVTKARVFNCDHPLYSKCTLFEHDGKGLAVVQRRYNQTHKTWWWSQIDPWLIDDIFNKEGFIEFFEEHAGNCTDGLYPTVTVRKLMWALKMKPIKKEFWEKDLV